MEEKTIKRYIAKDDDGDIYLYTESPYLIDNKFGRYWDCDECYGSIVEDGSMTNLGILFGFNTDRWKDILRDMNPTTDPIEVEIKMSV